MNGWTALNPSFTVPNILPPQPPLCCYARKYAVGWVGECDARALFIRTDEDGRREYACGEHARVMT